MPPRHRCTHMVEGWYDLGAETVVVRVGFRGQSPALLPHVYVDAGWARRIPHVEGDGRVCYSSEEGRVHDYQRLADVVADAIGEAVRTLRMGLSGDNTIVDDIEGHWRHADTCGETVGSYFSPGDEIRRLSVGCNGKVWRYVTERFHTVTQFAPDLFDRPRMERKALYIPLRQPEVFPNPQTIAVADIKPFVERHLEPRLRRDLVKRTKKRPEGPCPVILGVLNQGQRILVGLEFDGCEGAHPLNPKGHAKSMRLVAVERRDKEALLPRGGADISLRERQVVVAGCGAVGGHLATQLASAGLGQLTLVDGDAFTPANAFRHVLGVLALGQNKATATAEFLRRRTPYLDVVGIKGRIENLLGHKAVARADLMVLATGHATTNLLVSDELWRHGGPRLGCTWLEPLGLGGHVFIETTSRSAGPGCLRCIYDDLQNRADFAGAGQVFARESGGCGGAFTPFANSDAVKTADLATRAVVAALRGDLNSPLLRSWKGDAAIFRQHGYRTSPRYELSGDSLEQDPTAQSCPTCGGRA